MQRLNGSVISWQGRPEASPAQGIYPSLYIVTYNILAPTISGDRSQHTIEINCSAMDYPRNKPRVRFLTPVVKHPHFFDYGEICLGGFPLEESLAALCVRLGKFLQYDPTLINYSSIASNTFKNWYLQHQARLPLQYVQFPDVDDDDGNGMTIRGKRSGRTVPEPGPGNFTVRQRRGPGNGT
jgi:hypothetical protein